MKTDMQKMRNGELYRFDGEDSSPICPPQQPHLPTINNHIMRNKFFIGLLFGLFLPLHLVSQTREDVVAINTAMWETKKISENIEVRQMRWPLLYGCAQTVTVAEITPKRGLAFDIAVADGGATVGEMARRTKALAAINGSYFDIHKRSAITYLRQGRTIIDTTTTAELALRVTGAIRTHGRKLHIMPWNKAIEQRYRCRHGSTLASGHLLLYRGKDVSLRSSNMGFIVKKHPRTAIALTSRGTVLFVTVDGRHPGYAGGMNLIELRHFLQQLGCTDALNLDGGGSTTLWAKGYNANGIANYPCDNRKFDHDGERKVANAVVVMKRGK